MELRQLRYLIAIVDHGSFTRAALTLNVTQPALSQQIRQLEARMGVALLDRTGRLVRATDTGALFIDRARRALAELEAGKRAVADVEDLSVGALRVGLAPSFFAYLVVPLVRHFRERHPGIQLSIIEMSQGMMEAELADDTLDLGIAFDSPRDDAIDWHPLYRERLALIVGRQHPLWGERSVQATTLPGEQLVHLEKSFATRATINAYAQNLGIALHYAVETNSVGGIVAIVQDSGLATILPEAVAQDRDALHAIELRPAAPSRSVALLSRRGAYRSAAARAFVDCLDACSIDMERRAIREDARAPREARARDSGGLAEKP
jgi:LysR family transcriptional regulator, cyn operon transcriptional activator